MNKLTNKFLSLFLLLALAVSPLLNASASVSHIGSMSAPSSMQTDISMDHCLIQQDVPMQMNHCDNCEASTCDVSHCAASVVVLLPFTSLDNLVFSNIHFINRATNITIHRLYSTLYRPPRA